MDVVVGGRQGEAVALVRHRVPGIAAVAVVAGEDGLVAEVLVAPSRNGGNARTCRRARARRRDRPSGSARRRVPARPRARRFHGRERSAGGPPGGRRPGGAGRCGRLRRRPPRGAARRGPAWEHRARTATSGERGASSVIARSSMTRPYACRRRKRRRRPWAASVQGRAFARREEQGQAAAPSMSTQVTLRRVGRSPRRAPARIAGDACSFCSVRSWSTSRSSQLRAAPRSAGRRRPAPRTRGSRSRA